MNIGIIIIIAFLGLWALGVFLGVIGGFSKPFTHSPSNPDSSSVQSKEEQTIQDTEDKRRQMMDDIKDKLRDQSQRF